MKAGPQATPVRWLERRDLWWLAVGVVTAVLGGLSCWRLESYDVFWQVRAGEEILRGMGVQQVDAWSLTIRGREWINFQWLCTAVMAAVHGIAGVPGLVLMRAAIVMLWCGLLAGIVWAVAPPRHRVLLFAALVPAIVSVTAFRQQMRPDLLGYPLFTALLLAWLWPALADSRRILASCLVLLVWTNWHGGTVAFGGITAGTLALFHLRPPRQAVWAVVAMATATFLSPAHLRIVPVLFEHAGYTYGAMFQNVDFQPWTFDLLDARVWGFAFIAWIVLLGLFVAACVPVASGAVRLPERFSHPAAVLLLAAFFTWMSFRYLRVIPYQLSFALPVLVAAFPRLTRAAWPVGVAALVATWLWLVPAQVTRNPPLGLGLEPTHFPVGCARFINRVRPLPNIFNTYNFGGLVIHALRDYPVFIDGRYWPYVKAGVFEEFKTACSGPEPMREALERHKINVILFDVLPMRVRGAEVLDLADVLFPRDTWALVHFDNAGVVRVRRIPEHEAIIAAHEYRLLKPGLPGGWYLDHVTDPESRARLEAEVDRCLREEPDNVWCLALALALGRPAPVPEAEATP